MQLISELLYWSPRILLFHVVQYCPRAVSNLLFISYPVMEGIKQVYFRHSSYLPNLSHIIQHSVYLLTKITIYIKQKKQTTSLEGFLVK